MEVDRSSTSPGLCQYVKKNYVLPLTQLALSAPNLFELQNATL